MKLTAAFLTAAVALVGAASARADVTLSLGTIDASDNFVAFSGTQTSPAAGPFVVAGQITATGETIDSTSFTFNSGSATMADIFGFGGGDPDLASVPMTIPGTAADPGSFTTNDLFELTNLVPDASGDVSLSYFLNDPNGNTYNPNQQPLIIHVEGVAVPEPGTVALFASSLVGGSVFLIRRRRK